MDYQDNDDIQMQTHTDPATSNSAIVTHPAVTRGSWKLAHGGHLSQLSKMEGRNNIRPLAAWTQPRRLLQMAGLARHTGTHTTAMCPLMVTQTTGFVITAPTVITTTTCCQHTRDNNRPVDYRWIWQGSAVHTTTEPLACSTNKELGSSNHLTHLQGEPRQSAVTTK